MPARKLKEFLETQKVPYKSIPHPETFTAQRTAQSVHIRGKDMAKCVIVKLDGRMCMALVPAHFHINLDQLKAAAGAETAEIAGEQEFAARFPECDVGAMPPFGNLYDMKVFVQQELAKDKEIAFNAGTHTEVIRLAYADFDRLVKPVAGDFAAAF